MTYFYGHLFAIAPGIRGLFPASMHVQRQRLYRALREMADSSADSGNAARDDTVKDDTTKDDAAQDDTAKDDAAKDGTVKDDTAQGSADEGGATKASEHEQALAALGRAHRKFGVRPEHYVPFRAALLATGRHVARGEASAARAEATLAAAFAS